MYSKIAKVITKRISAGINFLNRIKKQWGKFHCFQVGQ